MSSDNSNTNPTHQVSLTSVFEWMPTCAMVIDVNGIISELNQKAIQFFKAATKEDFIFDKQNIRNMIVDSHRATELIKSITRNETFTKEILIRKFDKTIVGIDLHACFLPDNSNLILIQFTEKKPYSKVYMYELSQVFRREVQRLKPYLNKPGKGILEEIIIEDIVDSISENKTPKRNQVVVIGEDRMDKLTKMFPEFSNTELIFCGYLSLKMSTDEISSLTGKTPNSLRVTFHRILKKTTFSIGKEFLRTLEAI
jgi:hypothetical protein